MEDSHYWKSQSKRLTARARRSVLAQLVTEFVELSQADRYRFSDVLQAFSDYALAQSSELPDQKPIWEVTANLLDLAAQNALVAFERPAVRNQQAIQQSLIDFIAAVQSDGYTCSDILRALADYCVAQSGKAKKKQKRSWESIASLLESAAVDIRECAPMAHKQTDHQPVVCVIATNGSAPQPVHVSQF